MAGSGVLRDGVQGALMSGKAEAPRGWNLTPATPLHDLRTGTPDRVEGPLGSRRKVTMSSDYFSVHTHSEFSTLDGMGSIQQIVDRVVELGQPGWVLSDHGTLAGTVQAYKASKKAGLAFYAGQEFYVVRDVYDPATREQRYHLGMMALDLKGYQALVKLTTLSYTEDRFHRKPLIDLSDLAFLHDEGYADHIAVTTGCYFGLVVDRWQGPDPVTKAGNMIDLLRQWFPHLYVEVQNHGVQQEFGGTDLDIARSLTHLASVRGLPVVLGGDSHYVRASEQPVHDLMKDICYFGDGEDNRFPGGPYHLLSSEEAQASVDPEIWALVEEGHADLLDKHTLSIPPLDKYKFHVPKLSDTPEAELKRRCHLGLVTKGFATKQAYVDRLAYELNVINTMGMANYFLAVDTHVTGWCRKNGILVNSRGSVCGSLVAYLLRITNVDPLVWGTSFDRFLSLDRMKPPDIDVDVDFRGRDRLIEYLRSVFPTMVQVGTYARIGITSQEDDSGVGEDKGSVFVQYMTAMRRKDPTFDGKVKKEHRPALNGLAETRAYKSMGTNAAGFILPGESLAIDTYLPLGRIVSSNTTVTQYSKDDVEALGYMKMDILGLRALQTLNGTLVALGKKPDDFDWIPFDDSKACALLRSGNCTGIFQYEGFTSQRGGREMKIKTTMDAIIGLALYRPALDRQRPMYLEHRFGKGRPHALHRLFDSILKPTLGIPLFQEQIMEMLKTLGMTAKDWNELMTAIKASNGFIAGAIETFSRLQPVFYDLCEDAGMSPEEADQTWEAVVGFTEYGFNRGHATGYGLISYYMAYLKAHYPLAFMASLLEVWTGVTDKNPQKNKERLYTQEARRLGFSVVKADVNYSNAGWTIDPSRPNALRKGLVCLPGIGWNVAEVIVKEREANGSFADLGDFLARTPRRPVTAGKITKNTQPDALVGVCRTLYEAGAFRSLMP